MARKEFSESVSSFYDLIAECSYLPRFLRVITLIKKGVRMCRRLKEEASIYRVSSILRFSF